MILLDVFTFLGRMHPLVVHLPIGFIVLGTVFHAAAYHRKYSHLDNVVSFIFMLGFISALAASVFGYLLSLSGDYEGPVLDNHKVSGIILTLMTGLLYLMTTDYLRQNIFISRGVFTLFVAATFTILTYAGHLGASLTHGSNYLTLEVLLDEKREKPLTLGEALIFEDIVHPILEQRCTECHNSSKRKGRLSMESLGAILKGGKSGPSVVPANAGESELYRRVTLDPSHEDFMPADNKPPLTDKEKEIIRLWIEKAAAGNETKVSEITDNKEIMSVASSLFGLSSSSPSQAVLTGEDVNTDIPDSVNMDVVDNLREKGLSVRVMFQDPVMLDVTLPSKSGSRMSEIEDDLKSLAQNVIWLNLSDNNFTERDLVILEHMSNLERLRLEKNPLSDSIGFYLENLKHLYAVNLNETKITCACVTTLKNNPAIRRIYTWRTKCKEIQFER
jgi:uncharacterized membrane protein